MAADVRRAWPLLAALVLLALIARVVWAVWTSPVPPWLSDAEYYNATALSLARGDGYAVVFDGARGWLPGGAATAFWPPGYSIYLAIGYRLFGEHLWVARGANIIAGAATVVPVYFIGRRLFGDASGRIGAALAAVLPSLVFWTPVLLSDTFFTLLFAGGLAFVLYALDQGRGRLDRRAWALIVLTGLFAGASALVRGQGLLLIPLAVIWWLLLKLPPRTVALAAGGLVAATSVVLLPWTLRNIRSFGSPIVLSTNFGYNLRVGHAPYSTGRYLVPQDLWDIDPGISFKQRELVFNDEGRRRAIAYARTHIRREIGLTLRKVEWLWRPDSDVLIHVSSYGETPLPARAWEPLRLTLDSSYLAVLALALVSAARVATLGRGALFAIIVLAAWTAVHIVFFGEPRYHLPMLAVILPMAGSSLAWLAGRGRAIRRFRR